MARRQTSTGNIYLNKDTAAVERSAAADSWPSEAGANGLYFVLSGQQHQASCALKHSG